MALIARIEGAKVLMYANDHPPPHFHVLYAEHRAVIDLRTLRLSRGELPKAKLRMIVKWAESRRSRLLEAWDIVQAHDNPEIIR
jgi:hypothetical protein